MPADDGSDLIAVLAAEVVKQLPVKQALEPAASEVGGLGSDLVKCIRLALAPVQYLAVQQDRFRRFIEDSAARVPEASRVEPAPQILGPILEGIRYEREGSMSDEAFSRLLSRAFDREKVGQAHPSFPGLLRALSDDELKFLKKLKENLFYAPRARVKGNETAPLDPSLFAVSYPFLAHPTNAIVYCEHMEALGLIRPLVADAVNPGGADSEGYWVSYFTLRLSDFGNLFIDATLTG